MTRMSMVTVFLLCVPSCWCCEDSQYQHLLQRNEQLQRDMAALRREMEVLQTEAVGRGLQESPLECCPCNRSGVPNVTVLSHYENKSNTAKPLQDSSWQVTSGTTTNAYRQLAYGTTTSGTTTNPNRQLTPVTTTNPYSTTNPYWQVVSGDCVVDDDDCLISYMEREQYCSVDILDEWVGTLAVHHFSSFHYLLVNGVYYSAAEDYVGFAELPAALNGVVPHGTVYEYSGPIITDDDDASFKICRTNTTYEWTYWTCTVAGDDCTLLNDDNPNALCSTWYSGSSDHGHPWCMAPTADGSEQAQPCGPCSCLAGESQTYSSRVLADTWSSYEYILCTPCVPGTFKSIGGFGADDFCSPCSAGQHSSTDGATACHLCEAGHVAASTGSSRCAECGAGHYTAEGASVCESCAAGRVAASNGSSQCAACPAGHWSNADASACGACDPGHFAPGEGSVSCLPCTAGQFSATNSSTTCEDCVIGRFAKDSGMEQCEGCYDVLSPGGANPQLWTTMRGELWNDELVLLPAAGADKLDDCGCDAGAWMSLDSQCYECGEGVLCKGLGEVIVMEGYFAPSHDAGDVWKCHGIEKRCPGGSPGTCARNRVNTSLACGECTLGTRATTSGACEECGSGQPWLMALAALFLLVGLCVVYFVIAKEDRAKQKSSVALIAIIVSQVVTAMQVLGILNLLLVVWPEPFASFLVVSSVLHFDLDVLSPNCVVSMPALMSFGMTLFGFVVLLFVLILIHCVSVLVFFGGRFKEQMPSLIGVVGTTFMSVFISISTATLAPLQCDSHPNGYRTVQSYPQIICWSTDYENGDQHKQMVVLSVIASVVPICFVALCVWVVLQLPARMGQGDTGFLHTYAFLFFRFKPSANWYVLVLLARNLAAAVVPVIADEALQLLSLALVIGPCAVVCARALPWRIYSANMLDITTNTGFVLILFLGALHAEVVNEALIANMLAVVLACMCTLFALVFLRAVYRAILRRGKRFQFFLCHHKQGGGGFTRLLKWRLKRDGRVRRGVFLDADDLQDLNLLFGFVGNDTDTLVVMCTSEILARPWCVGEMTTARLHGVDVVLVVLPCFTWPTDEFLENYASHVPGIFGIAKFGISVDMVQVTLSWLKSRSRISLPHRVTLSVVDAVAGKLASRKRGLCEYSTQPGVDTTGLSSEVEAERRLSHVIRRTFQRDHPAEHVVQQLEDPAATLTCQAVAIVDRGNWEAVCAALLVREMLVPQLSTAPKRVPHVLTEDDALPPDTECALILCTNGCFHSEHFAKQLLAAAALGVHFIPVVAEENFHFPTEALYEEVRRRAPSTSQSQTFTAEHLVTVIGTIFEEIGIDVVLQGAEEIIAVHVAAIAGRLQETRSKRPLHFEAPVHNNQGKASLHSSESSEAPDRAGDLSASEGFLVDFDKI